MEHKGGFYHVIARGNQGDFIFNEDCDKDLFLRLLQRGSVRFNVLVYAYCVMGNHYHQLLETREANLSSLMHFIGSSFASHLRKKGRIGHIFSGRYKSICAERDEHALFLSRYIHLNPVRAGITSRAEDYPWSSFNSDYDRCIELAARVESDVGPVDVLINNAGIAYTETVLEMSAGAFRRITEVNYLGQVWMIKAFVPGMVERGSGHVVSIGSQAAKLGLANLGAYCGTKFATVGMTDAIRQELSSSGVRFTMVHPGYATTGMFEGAKVPVVTRWLDPRDVSDAVLRGVKKNKAEVFVPRLLSWMVGFERGLGMPRLADFLAVIMGAKNSASSMKKERGRPF